MGKKSSDLTLPKLSKKLRDLEIRMEKMLDTLEMLSHGVATHQELLTALAIDARKMMEKKNDSNDASPLV